MSLFAAIILSCIWLKFCSAENLDYKKVWLVDYNKFTSSNTINYLYRGNAPIVNNTAFAYDELVSYMKLRANASGLPFPSKFYFIDVSLDNTFDGEDFTIEREFWGKKGATEQFGIMLSYNTGSYCYMG